MRTVVKVGGSLFDLPDLAARLRQFIAGLGTTEILLVPGGGKTTDAIRQLDQVHDLGEEASHWLALRSMALNAHFLAVLLRAEVIDAWTSCSPLWVAGRLPILDAYRFARADEGNPGSLPHCWGVTSDSVAARAAIIGGAKQLVLLKSITISKSIGWFKASERGWVDRYFPRVIQNFGRGLEIRAVNLRLQRPFAEPSEGRGGTISDRA